MVLAFVLRLAFILSTDNFYGAIPCQKILYASGVSPNFFSSIADVHPILFAYLLKIWIAVFNDAILAPRLLSLVFGLIGVYFFYLFARISTEDESIALMSAFLMSVFSIHVAMSSFSMEETTFYFIIFAGLFLLQKYLTCGFRKKYLLAAALILSLSFGFRFEGIFYSAISIFYLLLKKDRKGALLFCLVSFWFPAFMLLCFYLKYKNPLIFATWQSFYSSLEIDNPINFDFIKIEISRLYPAPFIALGIIGFLLSLRHKKMGLTNIIFLVFFAVLAMKVFSRTLNWQERYLLFFAPYFLIYSAIGLKIACELLRSRLLKRTVTIFFIAYSLFFAAVYIYKYKGDFVIPDDIKKVIGIISADQKRTVLVDIDSHHEFSEPIAVNSRLGNRILLSQEIGINGKLLLSEEGLKSYKMRLFEIMQNRPFGYVLYSPGGRSLHFLFLFVNEQESLAGRKYKRIFKGPNYWVYRLEG